jgi:hypothetical protein
MLSTRITAIVVTPLSSAVLKYTRLRRIHGPTHFQLYTQRALHEAFIIKTQHTLSHKALCPERYLNPRPECVCVSATSTTVLFVSTTTISS